MRTLYYNGNIITMANQPMPQAILCQDGKIIAAGYTDNLKDKADELFDLQGMTMLPSFYDGHSHLTTVANTFAIADLSFANSIDEVVDIMKKFAETKGDLPEGDFLVGFGYDNNNFEGKKHPTLMDLDKISRDKPVIISHASGHMGVCNSRALKELGIDENTTDIPGGVIGKFSDGKPNGYLEETAFTSNAMALKAPSYEEMKSYMEKAQDYYFKYGITTIQDGFTGMKEWALLKKLSDEGALKADVVCYVDIDKASHILTNNPEYKNYKNNLRIGGYKLFLDGSPQGRTAWMTKPYENSGDYCGYPVWSDEQVAYFVEKAVSEKQQLLCHCNGDAAAEQFLYSYKKVERLLETDETFRPVMIHGQLARPDQMRKVRKRKMIASFFIGHTWQWGDVHLENFGERAMKICPVNTALENGVITTFHRDSPVLPPDVLNQVWCAVKRVTKNGVQLAESERISIYDALKSVTINGAIQYNEEKIKGTIEVGKEASFVILDKNPLMCTIDELRDAQVLYTILRDEVVYQK